MLLVSMQEINFMSTHPLVCQVGHVYTDHVKLFVKLGHVYTDHV